MTVKLIDPSKLPRMPFGIGGDGWVTSYSSKEASLVKYQPPSRSYVCEGCGDMVWFETLENCEKIVRASRADSPFPGTGLQPYYEPMCPTCLRIKKIRMVGFPTIMQKINNLISRLLKFRLELSDR